MRALVASGAHLDRDALVDLYAYPDPSGRRLGAGQHGVVARRRGERCRRALRLDRPTGRQAGLLGAPRAADVVVAGAGTVRAEGYSRPRVKLEDAERRERDGQARRPCLAVVTASGEVPDQLIDAPGRDDSGWRVVVLAAASTDPDRLRRLRSALGDDCVLLAGNETVDPATALRALAGLGLRRVLTEGGPSLLGRWLGAEVVEPSASPPRRSWWAATRDGSCPVPRWTPEARGGSPTCSRTTAPCWPAGRGPEPQQPVTGAGAGTAPPRAPSGRDRCSTRGSAWRRGRTRT